MHHFGYDLIPYWGPEFAWLNKRNIRTVIDVGANVGQFAQLARQALPEALIVSFEPIPSCFEDLKKSLPSEHFKPMQYALGEKEEKRTIHVSTYTPSSSLLPFSRVHREAFPHAQDGHDEIIEVRRLDEVMRDIPYEKELLVKLDVQGFEEQVIRGGAETMRNASVLFVETSFVAMYEGQELFDSTYNLLKSMGFRYGGSMHGKRDPKTGNILFEDSIFVNEAKKA